MHVIEHLNKADDTLFSFEIIPPPRGKTVREIIEIVEQVAAVSPPFIDVTSHMAEALVAPPWVMITAGVPHAIASNATIPKDS